MTAPLRLLIIEDQPDDADLTVRMLTSSGYEVDACRVDTEAAMIEVLAQREFDLVLSDWSLPGFGAEAALTILRHRDPHLPFVLVSGVIGEEAAFRVVRAGADDFVPKDRLEGLPRAVERSLAAAGARRQLREAEQSLESELRRFSAMHEHSTDVLALCGPDGAPRYTAVPAECGLQIVDLIEPPSDSLDAALAREAFQRALGQPGVSGPVEIFARHIDGTEHWWEVVWSNHLADPQLQGLVLNARDVTQRRASEDELRHNALHDELTGLPHRGLLFEHLNQALARQGREGGIVAVILLDLDGFKAVNDRYGHLVGDQVLAQIGRRLDAQARTSDMVARYGGDEFVAVCESSSHGEVTALVTRLLDAASQPCDVDGVTLSMSASAGLSIAATYRAGQELLREADVAAYRAKRSGGNRYEAYDERIQEEEGARKALETDLLRGFAAREFRVHYQPQVDVLTGRIEGVEALLRWQHPRRGLLLPSDFIAVAEGSGVIQDLGWWVLEQAVHQIALWQAHLGELTMSVNLSARQLDDPSLPPRVGLLLQQCGVAPARLCLEITETAVIDPGGSASVVIDQLAALGVQLAIDDFGTGYASLQYLQQLPVHIVKIDRSFIVDLDKKRKDQAIVRAVVAMSRAFVIVVVAEGVDRPEVARLLRELGCRFVQGFLYAQAAAADEILPLLDARLGPDGLLALADPQRPRALLFQDNPIDDGLVTRTLQDAGLLCRVVRLDDQSDCARALDDQPDVILVDVALPAFNLVRALAELRRVSGDIPVVVLSGMVGDEVTVSVLRGDDYDYLGADHLDRLGTIVRTAIA